MPSVDGERYDGPSAKRQKRILDEDAQKKIRRPGSEIFSPFRVSQAERAWIKTERILELISI